MLTSSFIKNCIAAVGAIAGGSVVVVFEGVTLSAQKMPRSDAVALVDAGDGTRVKFQIMAAVEDFDGKTPEEKKLVNIAGTDYRMGNVATDPADLSYVIDIVEDK